MRRFWFWFWFSFGSCLWFWLCHVGVTLGSGGCNNDDEPLFFTKGEVRVIPAIRGRGLGPSHAGDSDEDDDNTAARPRTFTTVNRSGSGPAGCTGPRVHDADLEGPPPLSRRSGTRAALSFPDSLSSCVPDEPGYLPPRASAEFPPGRGRLLGGASSDTSMKCLAKLVLHGPKGPDCAKSKRQRATTPSGNGNDGEDDSDDDEDDDDDDDDGNDNEGSAGGKSLCRTAK